MSTTSQIKKKIKLENIFKPEIRKIFRSIAADFRVAAAQENMFDVNKYTPLWISALDNHYRRVQRNFVKEVEVKQEENEEDKEELLLLALIAWRENNSNIRANLITHTTVRNINDALRLARNTFAEENKIPTPRELAVAALAILKRVFNTRVDTIATTETQIAAESTKYTKAEVESGLRPRVLGGGIAVTGSTKTWNTRRDGKVRPAHSAAEGQSKKMTEPFIVDGEPLMFPGDTSLGASIGNVVNCRCVATYNIV